ncbi:uncharacterized protein PAC_15123 [Phialocephala subalpina]|uniref:Uncharacterized protein n=1 Tax=Phialocephala subalpina TaxID=576137 RepID=A0A1L7XJM5_9HELO|nr:uncharacterized protein PAC_15123 [Phialocephala subalpina]
MFAAKMLDLESAETLNFISETLTEAHEKSNHLGVLITSMSLVLSRRIYSCDTCVPREILEAPGYGIGLSMQYLTLVTKHVNGLIAELTTSRASPEYQSMMERHLNQVNAAGKRQSDLEFSGPHEACPYGSEQFELLNKIEPDDIRILEDEIDNLIRLPDQALDIKHLGVSYPTFFHRPGSDLIVEALTQLGLPTDGDIRSSEYMAVSAYEPGMCHFGHVANSGICHGGHYHDKALLVVEYDNATFSVSHLRVFLSQMLVWDDAFIDPALGGHAFQETNLSESQAYCKNVTQRIAKLIKVQADIRKQTYARLERCIVVGELAHDLGLREALFLAFHDSLDPRDVDELLGGYREDWNPIFIPAMGAATLTKDYVDAPKPLGCSEPVECGRMRREVRRNSMMESKGEDKLDGEL